MNAVFVATTLFLIGVDPPKGNVSTTPSGGVGTAPRGNVGSFPSGNVGSFPRGNVGSYPTGNVGVYPRGNVDRYPAGNVSIYPRGNVDRIPPSNAGSGSGGNVDSVPSADAGTVPADPTSPKATKAKKVNAKDKAKPNAASDAKAAKTTAKKTESKAAEKTAEKKNRPGVTGPIVYGFTESSAGLVSQLESVRDLLNSVGHDYDGRRSAAVVQVSHAISNLRYGRSDPNARDAVSSIRRSESRWDSDAKLITAQNRLGNVASELRTNAYFHGSAALNAVERAQNNLSAALLTSIKSK